MRPIVCLAALMVAATPAWAHKLKVFAAAEGSAIVGTAYFAGGGKAMDSAGQVLGADGAVIASFRTDAEGGFRVPVAERRDYRVTVDSGDGHVAEALIPADDMPAAAIPATTAAADPVEAAVARQILPLRRQLDALEERTRFSDIMGGIGTIFGLFGIFAWIAARRSKQP